MAADPRQSTSRGGKSRRQIKRVVFFSRRIPELSGGSVAIVNLSHALRDRGYEVEHISQYPPSRSPEFPTTVIVHNEALHSGPVLRDGSSHSLVQMARLVPKVVLKRIDRWRTTLRLRRVANHWDAETAVVFTHVSTRAALARSGYRHRGDAPVFIGQHHSQFESLDHEPGLRNLLERYFSPDQIDYLTTLSEVDAEKFHALLGVPSVGMPNPLPPRTRAKSPLTSRRAVALARFSHEKQLDLMIRAFARATEGLPSDRQWTLDIYGAGETQPLMQHAVENSAAQDRVHINPPTTDPVGVLAEAELNLLSSSYEGFGMTIVEAGSCGVPSVVFDCSEGIRDAIGPGGGVLVSPLTEDAYAEALAALIYDEPLIGRMGEAASINSRRFSPEVIAARWERLLTDLSTNPTRDRHADSSSDAVLTPRAGRPADALDTPPRT